MKREQCPQCGLGRLRRRSSTPKGSLERVYQQCSRKCGFRQVLIIRPAQIISCEPLYGTTPEVYPGDTKDGE